MLNNLMSDEKDFLHIISIIQNAKDRAFYSVNKELIDLYWNIGEYISKKLESSEWGEGVVEKLAEYIKEKEPELKGFNTRNILRVRQFYQIYKNNTKVSSLRTQINWTNRRLILSKTKSMEEKEFYLRLSIKERYTSRELERQIDSGYFERTMISSIKLSKLGQKDKSRTIGETINTKVSTPLSQLKPNLSDIFKDTYILDFLDLPKNYSEKDLKSSLIKNFKSFILELGKDFAFIGEEYKLQVGNNDYFIDLLFYHRNLQCLVVFELKIDDFKPEFLGKLNFYLEALDKDIKKTYENPSVGVILCKSKDDEVVEYEQKGKEKAEYDSKLLDKLSRDLKLRYGKGFSRRNILDMRRFYHFYKIRQTLSAKLSWSHYIELLSVDEDLARSFYENCGEYNGN